MAACHCYQMLLHHCSSTLTYSVNCNHIFATFLSHIWHHSLLIYPRGRGCLYFCISQTEMSQSEGKKDELTVGQTRSKRFLKKIEENILSLHGSVQKQFSHCGLDVHVWKSNLYDFSMHLYAGERANSASADGKERREMKLKLLLKFVCKWFWWKLCEFVRGRSDHFSVQRSCLTLRLQGTHQQLTLTEAILLHIYLFFFTLIKTKLKNVQPNQHVILAGI